MEQQAQRSMYDDEHLEELVKQREAELKELKERSKRNWLEWEA